jgi:hypothetical protein
MGEGSASERLQRHAYRMILTVRAELLKRVTEPHQVEKRGPDQFSAVHPGCFNLPAFCGNLGERLADILPTIWSLPKGWFDLPKFLFSLGEGLKTCRGTIWTCLKPLPTCLKTLATCRNTSPTCPKTLGDMSEYFADMSENLGDKSENLGRHV